MEWTQTDEDPPDFWSQLELGTKRSRYALTIAAIFFTDIAAMAGATLAGISESINRPTYSCDGGPGYNKMDAPGNELLHDFILVK